MDVAVFRLGEGPEVLGSALCYSLCKTYLWKVLMDVCLHTQAAVCRAGVVYTQQQMANRF